LYCIDDLKRIIELNRRGREHAAEKARDLIARKSENIFREVKEEAVVNHTIRAYRDHVETLCQGELLKAKMQLQRGQSPEHVLEEFARNYTQKILHTPSVQLRQAGAMGQLHLLPLLKQLFAIKDPETELL